jgi:hypothetical protein
MLLGQVSYKTVETATNSLGLTTSYPLHLKRLRAEMNTHPYSRLLCALTETSLRTSYIHIYTYILSITVAGETVKRKAHSVYICKYF